MRPKSVKSPARVDILYKYTLLNPIYLYGAIAQTKIFM